MKQQKEFDWKTAFEFMFYLFLLLLLAGSIISIYKGWHNIDLAYNFKNIGSYDLCSDFNMRDIDELYIIGTNQIDNGCFGLILECILLIALLITKDRNEK